ncbi:hypothetical protein [Pinibacter soli]|uniref:Uncharacterized protein n=1 Tax=Pinibacter soli TaxID=3044211 RepID=A0ABT6RI77_9BACT|nr:hypothetical protein [Pinibacter soli]MDI3321542.1 hypothetical protein [Pinibacter soli]
MRVAVAKERPEDSVTKELKWWKNKAFVKELNRRCADWETGKDKGYTMEEIDASIEQLKAQS